MGMTDRGVRLRGQLRRALSVRPPDDPRRRAERGVTTASATVRAGVGRLAMRRFRTAELYGAAVVAWGSRGGGDAVVVHQMGKVASTAVVRSLEAAGAHPVYHVHALSRAGIDEIRDIYRRTWSRNGEAWHLWQSMHLERQLRRADREPWTVISLVRDPVARNVSSFFQVGESEYDLDLSSLVDREWDQGVIESLRDTFLHRFGGHGEPTSFFEDELGAVFGVDVFAAPFPASQGYDIIAAERARVLILRVEDLSRCFSEAIERFLGMPGVALDAANTSEGKEYGALYRRFREEVALPTEYLDRMYGSRYACHFYTEDELRAFRRRWARSASPGADPGAAPPATAG